MGCVFGRMISHPGGGRPEGEQFQQMVVDCVRAHCPPGGFNGGTDPGCPSITCEELVIAFTTGKKPERCVGGFPVTNNQLPLISPYSPDLTGPINTDCGYLPEP